LAVSLTATTLNKHFYTRDPSCPIAPLDEARAEVLLRFIDASQLTTTGELQNLVRLLHRATWGNPDVLPLLVCASARWDSLDSAIARARLAFLWDSFDDDIFESLDAHEALKAFCSADPRRLPPSIGRAIFNEPALDFYAFMKCHGPFLEYALAADSVARKHCTSTLQ
jgi:hypothetical protein